MTVPLSCGTRAVPSAKQIQAQKKVVHFMRHGITEMNVFLHKNTYNSPGFKDPLMYDTRLTPEGAAGAKAAASLAAKLTPEPEVLLVSPLTRALHTAALAFPHYTGEIEVEALVRERVWLSSDCGRSPEELKQEFPGSRYNFEQLPDIWWYNGNSEDPKRVVYEPDGVFKERVRQVKQLLLSRPESCIAMVAHWGLLHELTGHDFENSEIHSFELIEAGFTSLKNPLM